jgi:AraC-like DNA-binding protein
MTARIGRRQYAPHAHEEFAIGVCTDGLEVIRYRGDHHHAGPGNVVVLQPGEPHTGGPADERGFAYRVLYPVPGLLAGTLPSRSQDAGDARDGLPHFHNGVIDDERLARRILAAHWAMSQPGGDRLAHESMLLAVLDALVRRHAERVPGQRRTLYLSGGRSGCGEVPRDSASAWIARTVTSRLADELTAPPTLGELAAEMGVSRYRVVRGFREVMGMPPYAWLTQHRVTRARSLLDAGLRPAEVATLVGFADQPHLTRWFRRIIGVTPGSYRNSVQDGVRSAPQD